MANQVRSAWIERRPLRVVRWMPWTVVSTVVIGLVVLLAGLDDEPPSARMYSWFGLGVDTLEQGKLWTLLTTNYFIDHPRAFISSVGLVLVFMGVYELAYGTRWAIAVWFTGTIFASFAAIPIWYVAHLIWNVELYPVITEAEFGSSAAAWCALGAFAGWPALWRGLRLFAGLAGTAVVTYLLVAHHSFTEVEHSLAWWSGVLFFGWLQVRAGCPGRLPPLGRRTVVQLVVALVGVLVLATVAVERNGAPAWVAGVLGLGLAGTALLMPDRAAAPAHVTPTDQTSAGGSSAKAGNVWTSRSGEK